MPFYRFHIDADAPPSTVIERVQAVVRKWSFREEFRMWPSSDPSRTPFIGTVSDDSFRIYRDISGRNSFLPYLWGHVEAAPCGSRVTVTMTLHPLVFLILLFMLAKLPPWHEIISSWFFFAFLPALMLGGFIPEAIKAKRLLTEAIVGPEQAVLQAGQLRHTE